MDKQLEQQVKDLEQRVAALEGQVQAQQCSVNAKPIDEDFEQRVIKIIQDVVGHAFKAAVD